MQFSEQWLRAWIDSPLSTAQLAEQLTLAGLNVDTVKPMAVGFSGVLVGEIISCERHPGASALAICRVALGENAEPITLVSGAPNLGVGLHVALAPCGAEVAGQHVEMREVHGVRSAGMLCSARELGLGDDAEGILELPQDAKPGMDVGAYLQLADHIFELDITPNRGDCLSMRGIAREVGALNDLRVVSDISHADVSASSTETFPVHVQAPADCPCYLGRLVLDLKRTAVTPWWMRERLRRSGIRSINAIVDVTNYVLLELGQPLHAFDADKLNGSLTVRHARNGEAAVLLDGQTVTLEEDILVIADENQVQALAGVMGCQSSAVDAATENVFLECAYFAPEAIAGRARRYGISSESARRFERGVDFTLQHEAIARATALLCAITGGHAGALIECVTQEQLPPRAPILLRTERIHRLLGVDIASDEVAAILQRLGMGVESKSADWWITPPPFRFDIALEADLIEELARVFGYARIPPRQPVRPAAVAPQPERVVSADNLRAFLTHAGYQEAITYSFIDKHWPQWITPGAVALTLANPLSAELAVMRTSLWPGLIKALQYNVHRQQAQVKLFEIGQTFLPGPDGLLQEQQLACISAGTAVPEQWGMSKRVIDFFDMKGDAQRLFQHAGLQSDARFQADEHPALHPKQSARVYLGAKPIGWLGMLHPHLARELDLDMPTALLEITLSALLHRPLARFTELSKFPQVRRDLAVVVDAETPAQKLCDCIAAAAGDTLKKMVLFDVYSGKGVPSGCKSVALGLVFQDFDKTLQDSTVNVLMDSVKARLLQELDAHLRD